MTIAGIRKLEASDLLKGDESILVTHEGKISGLYLPLGDPDQIPENLRRDLTRVIGGYLAGILETKGVQEENVLEGFDAFRQCHR
jgi:hypothetical protein